MVHHRGPVLNLTQVSGLVKEYRRHLRRKTSPTFEDCYFVEAYTWIPGFHLHSFAWGGPLTEDTVTEAAVASGLGDRTHTKVERVTSHGCLDYGLKMVRTPTTDHPPANSRR